MLTATRNETRDSVFSVHARAAGELVAPPREELTCTGVGPELSERAAALATLLAEDPVDLARVSDEIRSQPELADAVKRAAASLQLLSEETVSSVEEAAIVLGTDRLRVLLHAWPAFHATQQRALKADAPQADDNGRTAARSPESLYLACFARLLGLPDGVPAATTEASEMSEILLRDLLTLLPRINLQLLGAVQRDSTR